MSCVLHLFVITLILPVFCGAWNENWTNCTDANVTNVGEKFFRCFDVEVKSTIRQDNTSCGYNLFPATIFQYVEVANKTCYKDTVSRERDALEFYKLYKFSLKRGGFKEFVENGGVGCIQAIKKEITQCVTNQIGNIDGSNNKHLSLWKKTYLHIEKVQCRKTYSIKKCTLKAIRSEGYYKCQYGEDLLLYVQSLFDYMLERCNRLKPKWRVPDEEPKKRPNLVIALAAILAAVLLVNSYVLVRTYRNNTGCWKRLRWRRGQQLVNESLEPTELPSNINIGAQ